jgi:uncharacterized protein
VAWTLVDAPAPGAELLDLAAFTRQAEGTLPWRRFAAGVLDEMTLSLHVHERVRIIEGDQ